ncbi:MAG TPA: energy transducer TonB [Bacteroidales bacterium]|nr:energy transducer TonB [Bacteroidales bacterium]
MKKKTQKSFLQLPKVTGGKKTFSAFLAENLVYPEEALKHGVEGNVHIEYEVDDNGVVTRAKVLKGLGYGLDEEALRLISILRFEKVRNRGVRLRSSGKTIIPFRLPATMVYTVVGSNNSTAPQSSPPAEGRPSENPGTISYTIEF